MTLRPLFYPREVLAEVLKYACEFGNKASVHKYSDELGFTISEGTVRNFKRTYLERLKSTPDPDAITSLPHASLGRPLLIGRYDEDVYDYIKRYVNECDVLMAVKTLTFLDVNMYPG